MQSVVRTLFSKSFIPQTPPTTTESAALSHTSAVKKTLKGKTIRSAPSPLLCDSPLVTCQQRQRCLDLSGSLITQNTVMETPTNITEAKPLRPGGLTSEDGSCGISCSQELFNSPALQRLCQEDRHCSASPVVCSIPDSPLMEKTASLASTCTNGGLELQVRDEGVVSEPMELTPKPAESIVSPEQVLVTPEQRKSVKVALELVLLAPEPSKLIPVHPSSMVMVAVEKRDADTASITSTDSQPRDGAFLSAIATDSASIPTSFTPALSAAVSAHVAVGGEPLLGHLPHTKRRRVATSTFLYPRRRLLSGRRSRQSGEMAEETVRLAMEEGAASEPLALIYGSTSRRKRLARGGSAAFPEKKCHYSVSAGSTERVRGLSHKRKLELKEEETPVVLPSAATQVTETPAVSSEPAMNSVNVIHSKYSETPTASLERTVASDSNEAKGHGSSVPPDSAFLPTCSERDPESTSGNTTLTGSGGSHGTGLQRTLVSKSIQLSPHQQPLHGGVQDREPHEKQEETVQSSSPSVFDSLAPSVSVSAPASGPTSLAQPTVGFQTASGHSIAVSARGMQRAQQLLAAAEDETNTVHHSESSRTGIGRDAPLSSADVSCANNSSTLPVFAGFQTASGSSIVCSKSGMKKALQLLSEEAGVGEGTEEREDSKQFVALAKTTSQQLTTKPTPQRALERDKGKALPHRTPLNKPSPLLTHSSGKPITRGKRKTKPFKAPRLSSCVSKEEEAANVARLLLQLKRAGADLHSAPVEPRKRATGSATFRSDFSTGSGKKLALSATSLQKARQLMADDKENGVVSTEQLPPVSTPCAAAAPTHCGFQLASGGRLQVSAMAMERAQSLLSSITEEEASDCLPGLHTPQPKPTASPSPLQSPSQSSFTADCLGEEDMESLAAFTQLQLPHREGGKEEEVGVSDSGDGGEEEEEAEVCEAQSESGMVDSSTPAKNGHTSGEESDREGDSHSLLFSTQVVRQFLDFSTDEDENLSEGLVSSSSAADTQVSPHVSVQSPPPTSTETQHSRLMDDGLGDLTHYGSGACAGRVLDSATLDAESPTGEVQEDAEKEFGSSQDNVARTDLSFYLQASSTSAIDELFGNASVDSTDTGNGGAGFKAEVFTTEISVLIQNKTTAISEGDCVSEGRESVEENIKNAVVNVEMSVRSCCNMNDMVKGCVCGVPSGDVVKEGGDGERGEEGREEVDVEGNDKCENVAFSEGAKGCQDLETAHQGSSPLYLSPGIPCGLHVEQREAAGLGEVKETVGMPLCGGDKELNSNSPSTATCTFPGLKTASGKEVSMSYSSLVAARAALGEEMKANVSQASSSCTISLTAKSSPPDPVTVCGLATPRGFLTASGKVEMVSDEALRAVKSKRESRPSSLSSSLTCYLGLQTASHRPVPVSEEAILQARSALQGHDELALPHTSSGFSAEVNTERGGLTEEGQGGSDGEFLSGSTHLGSSVRGSGVLGFQTASGKNVQVSLSAVKAARQAISSSEEIASPFVQPSGERRNEVPQSTLTCRTVPSPHIVTSSQPPLPPPPLHPSTVTSSSSSACRRFRPVFRRGHQTPAHSLSSSQMEESQFFPSAPKEWQSLSLALHSTPEGVCVCVVKPPVECVCVFSVILTF